MCVLQMLTPGLDVHYGGLLVLPGAQCAEAIKHLSHFLGYLKRSLQARLAVVFCDDFEPQPNVGRH